MDNKDNKNAPGYKVGIWIGRILWFMIILCLLAVGAALVASVFRLLIWYLTLIF